MTLLVVRRRRLDGLETLDLETYPLLVWLNSLAYSIFLRLIPTHLPPLLCLLATILTGWTTSAGSLLLELRETSSSDLSLS